MLHHPAFRDQFRWIQELDNAAADLLPTIRYPESTRNLGLGFGVAGR